MAAAVDIHAAGGALEYSAVSEWDLSAGQYLGVRQGTTTGNYVRISSLVGINIVGVVQNKPSSGEAVRVRILGITKALAGAAITMGDRVDVGATGYFRTAVSSNYAGIALETAVTSGAFKLLLNPQYCGAA